MELFLKIKTEIKKHRIGETNQEKQKDLNLEHKFRISLTNIKLGFIK